MATAPPALPLSQHFLAHHPAFQAPAEAPQADSDDDFVLEMHPAWAAKLAGTVERLRLRDAPQKKKKKGHRKKKKGAAAPAPAPAAPKREAAPKRKAWDPALDASGFVLFADVVERFAAENDVVYRPKIGRSHDGKQLFAFGKATIYLD
eukprot:CAMPEP_0119287202 /NCGR_PEP_ID=MMETSP1329-20130426/35162_1 /TAXON_ID=114041 /ORGANISM="Genus nov. species nov., Strain RCC1024" /LENGTH=148 /DNA_ID=CAMNT_0007287959 /DNA_START=122 /DNA_END=565 /DNA_ORIENTATION=+